MRVRQRPRARAGDSPDRDAADIADDGAAEADAAMDARPRWPWSRDGTEVRSRESRAPAVDGRSDAGRVACRVASQTSSQAAAVWSAAGISADPAAGRIHFEIPRIGADAGRPEPSRNLWQLTTVPSRAAEPEAPVAADFSGRRANLRLDAPIVEPPHEQHLRVAADAGRAEPSRRLNLRGLESRISPAGTQDAEASDAAARPLRIAATEKEDSSKK